MARGPHTWSLVCAADGCRETAHFESPTLRDRRDSMAHYVEHPYKCYRHSKPNEVLSADNPHVTTVLVRVDESYGRKKFLSEDGTQGGGLLHGPGWRVIAADFPPGTKLTVTATIELPEDNG